MRRWFSTRTSTNRCTDHDLSHMTSALVTWPVCMSVSHMTCVLVCQSYFSELLAVSQVHHTYIFLLFLSRHLRKSVIRLKSVSGSSSLDQTAEMVSVFSVSRCAGCQERHFSSFILDKLLAHGPAAVVPAFRMRKMMVVSLIYCHSFAMTTKTTFQCWMSPDVSCRLLP